MIYSNDPFNSYQNTIDNLKKGDKMLLSPANTQNETSTKRDISAIQNKVIKAMKNENLVTNHFYNVSTARRVSKYGVLSGPITAKYGPEKIPYLNTFHGVIWTSKFDKNTSLGQYLKYCYQFEAARSLADHDYVQQTHYLMPALILKLDPIVQKKGVS